MYEQFRICLLTNSFVEQEEILIDDIQKRNKPYRIRA